jgi:RNA polymerase sigma-70 factor, ECF subfamily
MDDRMILGLLAARESRAMESVYDRWAPLAYAIALRIVHDPDQAEKVVLEAYLSLWRHPELALQHYDSIRAYLCAVVSCDARLRRLTSRPLQAVSGGESGSMHEVMGPRRKHHADAAESAPGGTAPSTT